MPTRLIAGAMSGTSADGVDVALVAIDGRGLEMSARLVRQAHHPYDTGLRRSIFALRSSGQVALRDLARCGREVSLAYAAAVREALTNAKVAASDLSAVAAHGQTLFHEPPETIQWIDPALLAAEVGGAVVSDFRRADCAAGGQGAPLVPFGDYILFHHPTRDRAVVNIGGIANITFLPAGAPLEKTIAFDTGPGNCISDFLMREHDPDGPGVDRDGRLASRGKVVRDLVDAFMEHPYFRLFGPKSTDGPQMIEAFVKARQRVGRVISLEDQLATACSLTTGLIWSAVRSVSPDHELDLIGAGGGAQNQTLMRQLEGARRSEEFGIPTDARESVAFALLGAATLDAIPANVPSCTGARRAVVLGAVTPRP